VSALLSRPIDNLCDWSQASVFYFIITLFLGEVVVCKSNHFRLHILKELKIMDNRGEANKDKEESVIVTTEVKSEAGEKDVLHHPPASDQTSR
jgi:hypothetical protein